MKINILKCLVLCMLVVFLTGCKSSDYKQAQSLYIDGEYLLAKTMFEELGDYEDSRQMVIRCNYAQGKKLVESGDFDQAEEYLLEVGAYEDAQQILKDFPVMKLMHFLETNGELVSTVKVSDGSVYDVSLSKLTEDTIKIIYDFKGNNSSVSSHTVATMVLELGQHKMQVQGTYDHKLQFFGKTSTAEEAVEGELDIRTYKYGDEMLWTNTFFKGYDVNGKPTDPKVSGFFQVASNAPLERAFKAVASMLEENHVGVTLKEIGFASLEN